MLGLETRVYEVNPTTTLEKLIFIFQNVMPYGHRLTCFVSFGALAVVIILRLVKMRFRNHWLLRRLPDVLIVVILSTSEFSKWLRANRGTELTFQFSAVI